MSTHAYLAFPIDDLDNYVVTYVHSDGYPEYCKKVLNGFYTQPELAKRLVETGEISVLGATIGEKTEFRGDLKYVTLEGCDYGIASQCVYYGRDRGDKNSGAWFETIESLCRYTDYTYRYDLELGRWLRI